MSTTRVRGSALSPEQAAAAHAGPQGAFLIAAGPGTGKTFTATERFCWLVEQGVAPDRILTVTFSDRAAEQLRRRITAELSARRPELGANALDGAWIGTFHSVCARLLDEFAYLVGAPREMRVLDETGQRLFEQELLARLRSGAAAPFDPDSFTALSVDDLDDLLRSGLRFLLKLKGRGISPEHFHHRAVELHAQQWSSRPSTNGSGGPDPARAEAEAIEVLFTIYRAYEDGLHVQGLRDFDDLLLEVIDALERVPEFRRRCRERFRYLIVDEFQDTNRIQLDFIRLVAAEHFGNVTVVGDAKQSIYGWRDAEIENIRSRFPSTRLPLTHNRRSFQGILDCATDFIRRDPDFSSEPELVATRGAGSGPPVSVMMAPDARTEARSVAETIRRLHVSGRTFREIAVLSHSVRMLPREFEDELRRQGIPYVTSGGSGFFDRQEIKDVLALLRLTENPMDDGALVRILQGPIVRLADAGMYRLASRRFERSGMRLRDCFDESMREGFPEMDGSHRPTARHADRRRHPQPAARAERLPALGRAPRAARRKPAGAAQSPQGLPAGGTIRARSRARRDRRFRTPPRPGHRRRAAGRRGGRRRRGRRGGFPAHHPCRQGSRVSDRLPGQPAPAAATRHRAPLLRPGQPRFCDEELAR
jgi:ATP-dependent DNA helicase UvrD/PcrA